MKVCDDAVLQGCLIGFPKVKEETNCLLPLDKRVLKLSFKTHQVVGGATMFPGAMLAFI